MSFRTLISKTLSPMESPPTPPSPRPTPDDDASDTSPQPADDEDPALALDLLGATLLDGCAAGGSGGRGVAQDGQRGQDREGEERRQDGAQVRGSRHVRDATPGPRTRVSP